MSDIDVQSDFGDQGNNYDLNDYTQEKYDGLIGSGNPTPEKESPDKQPKGRI